MRAGCLVPWKVWPVKIFKAPVFKTIVLSDMTIVLLSVSWFIIALIMTVNMVPFCIFLVLYGIHRFR